MPDNFETYAKEYADAAGLRVTDMPSSHHPLLESNDEVRELADLIDVRENQSQDPLNARELGADDPNLDIQEALTFPHPHRSATSAERTDSLSGFDADARTRSKPDDEDDSSYMTRADFEERMDETDPDPNVGGSNAEYIGDARIDRAPDMSGTVQGIARGMSTHLPQDVGAGGFQIIEPEELEASLLVPDGEAVQEAGDPDADGHRIPTATPNINAHDDALDANRQLR